MKTKPAAPRGYLLMEAMVGGAMAGVIIISMLTVLAETRAKNVAAARDITANQLVTEALEQARASASPRSVPATVLTEAGGVYTRTVVETVGGCTESRPNPGGGAPFTLTCSSVTVTVTYTSLARTRTVQASTRIYP